MTLVYANNEQKKIACFMVLFTDFCKIGMTNIAYRGSVADPNFRSSSFLDRYFPVRTCKKCLAY